jgi:retron-type reverse transcriptase
MIHSTEEGGELARAGTHWREEVNRQTYLTGRLLVTKTGTGQGQVISPLLANIYLHYVLMSGLKEQ